MLPSRIILAGRSLGSAVAADLATRVGAAGLVLFVPIDSVPSVASRLCPWAPVRLLASYQFDTRAKARALTLPVLLIHARTDQFVPATASRSLFEEFRGPKLRLETGGGHHSAGFIHLSELSRALSRFWPPDAEPLLY